MDVNDPSSGITGSASYLADLQASSGSWVTALQSYGDLPNDLSGSLTAGQQNALAIAQNADATGDPYSNSATYASNPTAVAGLGGDNPTLGPTSITKAVRHQDG